jgi:hypothetical protein
MENQELKNEGRPADQEPREPFRLAGSMKLLVPDEELEAGIAAGRKHQAALFEAKVRRWLED